MFQFLVDCYVCFPFALKHKQSGLDNAAVISTENGRNKGYICSRVTSNKDKTAGSVCSTLLDTKVQSRRYLDSKGIRRWCTTLRISGFLDFVHRPKL
jgi:hypothetical protein